MEALVYFLEKLQSIVFSLPLASALFLVSVFLTFRLKGLQFVYLSYALKIPFQRADRKEEGDISHYGALTVALAASLGTANITGVATAVILGGVGAVFWLCFVSLFIFALKYAESFLALSFRQKNDLGDMSGGPMYYMEKGLKNKGLAIFFAASAAAAALLSSMSQANVFSRYAHEIFEVDRWLVGVTLALIISLVILGGIRGIAMLTSLFVPFSIFFYVISACFVVYYQWSFIPDAIFLIFTSAFTGSAVAGGTLGATVMMAMQTGALSGIFSSGAGLGSTPIVAATAKSDHPARHALVSMTVVFWDSFVLSAITGLVFALTEVSFVGGQKLTDPSAFAIQAFSSVLPLGGVIVVTISLLFFLFGNMLAWAYYGQKCFEYLFGSRSMLYYRFILLGTISLGSTAIAHDFFFVLAGIALAFMALPNLLALVLLSGLVKEGSEEFSRLLKREKLEAAWQKKESH